MWPKLHNSPSETKTVTDQEYYASLPKKRIGVCVLLFYRSELLIVQPTYRLGWILPGGTVEGEESPLEGLNREIQEELSLTVHPTQLLCVDYVPNLDVKGEYLQLLFAAKDLTEAQIENLRLSPEELREHRFVDTDTALELLTPAVARRVRSGLEAREKNSALYLENGNPLEAYLKLSMAAL